MNFPVDYFTGNGSNTSFSLSRIPASVTSIMVYENGLKRIASSSNASYVLNGSNLVFLNAPANNATIEVNHLGILSQVNVPSDQSITGAMLANNIVFSNIGFSSNTSISVTDSTTSTTAQTAIDTFSTNTIRTTKYLVSMSSQPSSFHTIELLINHNGVTPTLVQYGEVIIGSSLATFDASINSTVMSLLVNPTTSNTINYKLLKSSIGV